MSKLPLITEPEQLAAELDASDLIILDLRDPETYANGHIPNAINFSLGEVVRTAPPTGGLLPNAAQMSQALSRIGYTGKEHIAAVDDNGGPQAARLVWTLETFGIENASFLNGGMVAWMADIGALDSTIESPQSSQFQAQLIAANSADRDYIAKHLNSPQTQLVDARTAGEYSGQDVRSARGGHIPGAIHFDWIQLKNSANMKLKPLDEIQSLVDAAEIRKDAEIISYCQTHMRSSVVCLALRALGYPNVKGYPGAWSDWGNQEDTPIE